MPKLMGLYDMDMIHFRMEGVRLLITFFHNLPVKLKLMIYLFCFYRNNHIPKKWITSAYLYFARFFFRETSHGLNVDLHDAFVR